MEIDAIKAHCDSFVVTSLEPITLLSYDANRKSFIIQNGDSVLFLKLGSGASPTSFSYRIPKKAVLEVVNYRGLVSGVTASGVSSINVTRAY